jgi:predicted RNase H-like nuclease
LLEHQKLQDSVNETKEVIDELLSFSKDEIEKFSDEFKKATKSMDTITDTFSKINKRKYLFFYVCLIDAKIVLSR